MLYGIRYKRRANDNRLILKVFIFQLLGMPFLTQISHWLIEHEESLLPFLGIGLAVPVCFIAGVTRAELAFTSS
jgi:hypothetical protein